MDKDLKTFQAFVGDLIGKAEVKAAMKELAAGLDKKHDTHKTEFLTLARDTLKAIKDAADVTLEEYRRQSDTTDTARATKAEKLVQDKLLELDDAITRLDQRILEIKDGEPGVAGKDADEEAVLERVYQRIVDNLPSFAEAIRNGLELFEGDERVYGKEFRRIADDIKFLKSRTQSTYQTPPDFRAHFKTIDISDQLDGVTTTFNIPAVYKVLAVYTSSFPNALRPTIDFTHTATTITFTSQITPSATLATGQTVILECITN